MTREQAVRALRAKMNGNGAGYQPVGSLASEVTPERVTWVWSGRLALGKISMMDGNPGLGKSTMLLDIAARMSTGAPFPGMESRRPPAGVVIMSAEDGVADTIVPRLAVAGADLSRVYILRGLLDLEGIEQGLAIPAHLGVIGAAIERMRAQLLIVDPLMAYFGSDVNANKDQDVRRALAPFADLLERERCAGWLVRHLTKGESKEALYRGGGSIGIIGAARFGTMVAKDPDDPDGRVVAPTKVNLGPEPPSLRYSLLGVVDTDVAKVIWADQPSTWSAQDLLADQGESGEEREEAEMWLEDFLHHGPRSAQECWREAKKAGHGERAVRRAKKSLHVKYDVPAIGAEWSRFLPNHRSSTMSQTIRVPWGDD